MQTAPQPAAENATTFKPTHLIRWTPKGGETATIPVALVEGGFDLGVLDASSGGPAYTREEWDSESPADWERQDDGSWTCLGQATPGGANGTVEVKKLRLEDGRLV